MGANLTNKKFARDLDSVIQRAQDAGVSKIMVTGTSVKSSKDALRLSQLYPGIQSFSALKKFDCARAQSENLRSCSIFARPYAHACAQNVLSAAQFCAHFRIFEGL